MKIQIKTLKGELFQIEAELSDHVLDLKNKIQESKGDLLSDRQKLIHSGKVLKDEQSVSELGISESDFIVCMITKEVAKKPVPAVPVPVPVSTAPVPTTPVVQPNVQPNVSAVAPVSSPDTSAQFETTEGVAALTGMGFPETESRAALRAAMGNADLAYEFLLTGIPERRTQSVNRATADAVPVNASNGGIESLRRHPQFNMLKQLVQQDPASLPRVLDLIGQQDPALLAAIHANNDAFIAMMNEPISEQTPAAVPQPNADALPMGGMGDPAQMIQMLGSMPPAQRAQFAQTLGMTPAQLEGFMQMMASMPPDQLQQMMAGAGGGGHGGQDAANVVRLTHEEMESVNRLMALGFSQQEAAQAYIACDKNEALAANLLLEGGWADDEDAYGGHDDDMYH